MFRPDPQPRAAEDVGLRRGHEADEGSEKLNHAPRYRGASSHHRDLPPLRALASPASSDKMGATGLPLSIAEGTPSSQKFFADTFPPTSGRLGQLTWSHCSPDGPSTKAALAWVPAIRRRAQRDLRNQTRPRRPPRAAKAAPGMKKGGADFGPFAAGTRVEQFPRSWCASSFRWPCFERRGFPGFGGAKRDGLQINWNVVDLLMCTNRLSAEYPSW